MRLDTRNVPVPATSFFLSVYIKPNGLHSACSNHVLYNPVRVAGIESTARHKTVLQVPAPYGLIRTVLR